MNFQKTYILGRVAHTPEMKTLESGTQVTTFSMATNRNWKDANDQPQEAVEWHNLIAFGKTAEILAKYVEGGQLLFIEGRNQTRSWEDKTDGGKRYRTEVVIEKFQFGAKSGAREAKADGKEEKPAVTPKGYDGPIDYGTPDVDINDIPF